MIRNDVIEKRDQKKIRCKITQLYVVLKERNSQSKVHNNYGKLNQCVIIKERILRFNYKITPYRHRNFQFFEFTFVKSNRYLSNLFILILISMHQLQTVF